MKLGFMCVTNRCAKRRTAIETYLQCYVKAVEVIIHHQKHSGLRELRDNVSRSFNDYFDIHDTIDEHLLSIPTHFCPSPRIGCHGRKVLTQIWSAYTQVNANVIRMGSTN